MSAWRKTIDLKNFHATAAVFLLAALCTIGSMVAGCASGRGLPTGGTVRVLTWNIHHAEGTDGKVDIDRVADVILKQKVDVVALQEIDRGVERTKKVDMLTSLADRTSLTYAFGKTIDYQGGEYGNGILTRFPILEERNLLYASSSGREQRGLQVLVLEFKGEEFVIANTHFDSGKDDSARAASVDELKRWLQKYSSRPIILCGDFNDVPESGSVAALKKDFGDAWELAGRGNGFTYPSNDRKKRIDYVFSLKDVKPDSVSTSFRFRPVAARVVASNASDHLPLIVEFTFSTK